MSISFRSEYRGASSERRQEGDFFASESYLKLCEDQARRMGLNGDSDPFAGALLRRLKHSLVPSRWLRVFQSLSVGKMPDFETSPHLAPFVEAAREILITKATCRVLDIGGGWGDSYLLTGRALLNDRKRLDYSIVDNSRVTKLGSRLYKPSTDRPTFLSDLPNERFDIVLICGTLQYIDGWQDFMIACKQKADAIYLTRSAMTEDQCSFYTQQNVFIDDENAGSYPYCVISRPELLSLMKDWRLDAEQKLDDYSPAFASLPNETKAATYVHLWRAT